MKTTTIEVRKITASKGHYITNADNSICAKEIYLGVNDEMNYTEITDKDAIKILEKLNGEPKIE